MSEGSITYRPMQAGEEQAVYDLVERCFGQFVAPDFSSEGTRQVLYYAQPERLKERAKAGHFVLVAEAGGALAGMIEIRECSHISLLFVDEAYQRQGISRGLLNLAMSQCRANNSDLHEITVNSSPYAVPVYERLGFQATAEEQERSGIRFTPMKLVVP